MKPYFSMPQLLVLFLVTIGISVSGHGQSASGNHPTKGSTWKNGPVRYVGDAQVNYKRADGGLPWAVGVQSYQVLRAARLFPRLSEGLGWTYHHNPMLAYWNGKFYLEFTASPTQENGLPTAALLTTSSDGRNWSMPEVIFPAWNDYKDPKHPIQTHLHERMGFYVAPNGRLLVISHYALWGYQANLTASGGPGHVVREIHKDGSFGPIYFIRYGEGWNASNTPYPFYKTSTDKGFLQACEALLANKFVTDQWYELAKGYPAKDYIAIAPNPAGKMHKHMEKRRKALSFYTLPNGNVVGLWKSSYTSISTDKGKTWSFPIHAPGFARTFAKAWGQRTSDGRYAIAYDPVNDPPGYRWPLAVVTSKDGITFNDMLTVQGEVPLRRYDGLYKDNGSQYVRGIAEGNPQPPGGDLWLTYSMNKEDIWVSRVPVPIRGSVTHDVHDSFDSMSPDGVVTDWNIYSPRWAPVEVADFPSQQNKSLMLKDGDPYDYARATRIFPVSDEGEIGFKVMPRQTDAELDIDMVNTHGGAPIRIVLSTNGRIEITNGLRVIQAGSYTPNNWLTFKINYDAAKLRFSVAIDGKQVLKDAAFAVPVSSLERISFRTGPKRTVRFDQTGGGITGHFDKKHYFGSQIDPLTDHPLKNPAIYYLDDVQSQNQ